MFPFGGTLTPYAAPPVLMVAGTWGWDIWFMFGTFGWKAALAVLANAGLATWLFRAEVRRLTIGAVAKLETPVPLIVVHLAFLLLVVVFAHHPTVFSGLFLFFLGVTYAYQRYQNPLILREGLLVAFFLAGLVTLGTQQRWWLQETLVGMDSTTLFFGSVALTAIIDNAALTYLGSLVQGVDAAFQYALVAGAVTGGGLTVIANAPNPAVFAILRREFEDGAISPVGLVCGAARQRGGAGVLVALTDMRPPHALRAHHHRPIVQAQPPGHFPSPEGATLGYSRARTPQAAQTISPVGEGRNKVSAACDQAW